MVGSLLRPLFALAILALPSGAAAPAPSTIVQAAIRPAGGGWGAPQSVSRAAQPSSYASFPQVAVDAKGDAVAVWERFDGKHYVVQASARPARGAWGAPQDLSAGNVNSFNPDVALDAAGDAVAVWGRDNRSDYRVQSAVRPAGGGWSAATTISAPSSRYSIAPHVAVDAAGDAVAVWHRVVGQNILVEAAVRPAAGSWGAPEALASERFPNDFWQNPWPEVAMDAAGDAFAVWQRFDGLGYAVTAAVRHAGGAWEGAQDVFAGMPDLCTLCVPLPQVGAGPGGATAAWTDYEYDGAFIEVATRPAAASWSAPQSVSAPEELPSSPEIALDGAGDTVAVWLDSRLSGLNTHTVVRAATRPVAGAWSTPRDLSAASGQASSPQVGVDAAGAAVAVWGLARSSASPTSTVQASANPAGGAWSAPQSIATAGSNPALAQVAVGAAGDAVAVWSALPPCVVPRVVGKRLAAAKLAIARGYCRTGRVGRAYSARIEQGRVLSQRPAPGTRLANGAGVRLVVSRGPRSR